MRIIYRGYAVTTYGQTRLSVTDREGKEIFTNSDKNSIIKAETESGLREFLKSFIKEYEHANKSTDEKLHNSDV